MCCKTRILVNNFWQKTWKAEADELSGLVEFELFLTYLHTMLTHHDIMTCL